MKSLQCSFHKESEYEKIFLETQIIQKRKNVELQLTCQPSIILSLFALIQNSIATVILGLSILHTQQLHSSTCPCVAHSLATELSAVDCLNLDRVFRLDRAKREEFKIDIKQLFTTFNVPSFLSSYIFIDKRLFCQCWKGVLLL